MFVFSGCTLCFQDGLCSTDTEKELQKAKDVQHALQSEVKVSERAW